MTRIVDEVSVTGLWLDSLIYYTHMEASSIVFENNGKGFIHWYQLYFETINTFEWSIDQGCMTIKGINSYSFECGENTWDKPLIEKFLKKEKSLIMLTGLEIALCRKTTLDDREVDAICFGKPENFYFHGCYGLDTKNYQSSEYYKEVQRILEERS